MSGLNKLAGQTRRGEEVAHDWKRVPGIWPVYVRLCQEHGAAAPEQVHHKDLRQATLGDKDCRDCRALARVRGQRVAAEKED